MKRKNEELLIELAFGDLDAAEAERLRSELSSDPTQQATLRSYEELRASIGGLRDVPEMQLSRERLRDAILAGGLRETRRYDRWAWLGAPVAIAAVAFAFTMIVRQPAVPLPSGVALATNAAEEPFASMDPTLERNPNSVAGLFGNEELKPYAFSERAEPPVEKQKITAPAEKRIRVVRAEPKTQVEPAPVVTEPGPAAATLASASAPPATDAGMTTAGVVEESTEIIVLTSETDIDTGARRATSMESSSNVVIGG
jgi:hypothetical protein